MANIKSGELEDLVAVRHIDADQNFDGGLQAWAQVFGSFWIWFNTW